ncbi:MAG: hypothetical protein WD768_15175 [Phycisphaeraceae bacterium]
MLKAIVIVAAVLIWLFPRGYALTGYDDVPAVVVQKLGAFPWIVMRQVQLMPPLGEAYRVGAITFSSVNFLLDAGLTALLIALAVGVRREVRHKRVRQGRCGACGYDLRGTAGDTCAECGSARSTRKTA